jgi:glycosyltransferase involved in cell wall biosynthesis
VTSGRASAVVAARNEADRIGATVSALRGFPELDDVVVVDDASSDGTGSVALAAGASVIRVRRRVGKGGAVEGALRRLAPADVWLFADGDLGESATALGPVLSEVLGGRADLAVAVFPSPQVGGLGLVKRAARGAIRITCGLDTSEPLSGQRAISRDALEACRPLSNGFGMETGMTIDAVRGGFRVVEVPAALSHRATGRDVRGFAHRGRQGLDMLMAAVPRALGLR